MTKLLPERMWPEIREHIYQLIERGLLPREFDKAALAAIP
jgi:heptosyltransferase-2